MAKDTFEVVRSPVVEDAELPEIHQHNDIDQPAIDVSGGLSGSLDHGSQLSGLTDDDHTQYLLRSILTTKGDIYVATGVSTVVRLAVGSNNQVLTADSAQSSGVKWADSGSIVSLLRTVLLMGA